MYAIDHQIRVLRLTTSTKFTPFRRLRIRYHVIMRDRAIRSVTHLS
jgi:hypothetical protein